MMNPRLRFIRCEDPRSELCPMDVPYQHGDSISSSQRVAGDHTAQGTSTTLHPPLVLVQTPQPRPLARNAYFYMVDRRKITVEPRLITSPSCCASVNTTWMLGTMIPSCMSGAHGIPDSRDGA